MPVGSALNPSSVDLLRSPRHGSLHTKPHDKATPQGPVQQIWIKEWIKTGTGEMGNGSKPLKINGRHEETRTPDLYRVNSVLPTAYITARAAPTLGNTCKAKFRWIEEWIEQFTNLA